MWAPDFPGLATTGTTEEEAVRNIQKAIRGRLDLELEPAETTESIATTVDVMDAKETVGAPLAVRPQDLPGPVPFQGLPQLYLGLGVFLLGFIGVAFYLMIEPQSSPLLLFMPIVVLALGAAGLFFGAISLEASKRSNRPR